MVIGVHSLLAHVVMKTRWLVIRTVVDATFAIVLSWLLIPAFVAVGSGIALATSGFVVIIFLYLFFFKFHSLEFILST